MYVIAGASGQTGRATADALLDRGAEVTVLVRDPAKGEPWRARGAEVAVASLEDSAALTPILARAAGVYLLTPPNYGAEEYVGDRLRLTEATARAVRDSGIPHVVYLSSFGAQIGSGNGPIRTNHDAETIFRKAARGLTLLRAAYFLDNWRWVLQPVLAAGVLPSFLRADLTLPQVSTLDIGRLAAQCLLEPTSGCRVIELAGPTDYSAAEVAQALGDVLGRPVTLDVVPEAAIAAAAQASGLSPDVSRLFAELYSSLNAGRVPFEGGAIERRRGTTDVRASMREIIARA